MGIQGGGAVKVAKVKTITIAALYNTGNYEHVRYELTVEVPNGVNAKDALLDTTAILAALRPIKQPWNYDSIKARLAKHPDQLTEAEKASREDDLKVIAEFETARVIRAQAIEKLDQLGGRSKRGGGRRETGDVPF